ncbi:hypothetical protein AAAT94_00715 [Intestinimonas aquisgranensis]|nr:hypothetical protein [Intestinimonas aquisgranensis]
MAASSFYAAVEAVRAKKNGGFGTVKAADIYMGVSNELLDAYAAQKVQLDRR